MISKGASLNHVYHADTESGQFSKRLHSEHSAIAEEEKKRKDTQLWGKKSFYRSNPSHPSSLTQKLHCLGQSLQSPQASVLTAVKGRWQWASLSEWRGACVWQIKQRVATITIDFFLTPPRSALDLTGWSRKPQSDSFSSDQCLSRDCVGGANQGQGKSMVWSEQLGNKRPRKKSIRKLPTTLSQR